MAHKLASKISADSIALISSLSCIVGSRRRRASTESLLPQITSERISDRLWRDTLKLREMTLQQSELVDDNDDLTPVRIRYNQRRVST